MATRWADDYDAIRTNMKRIEYEEKPRCPKNSMTLYACLRAPQRCSDDCPHYHDWIGPDAND